MFAHIKMIKQFYLTNRGDTFCTTTQGQSEPKSNGNDWVFHVPRRSRIGASQSNSLVSYQGHSLGVFYRPA